MPSKPRVFIIEPRRLLPALLASGDSTWLWCLLLPAAYPSPGVRSMSGPTEVVYQPAKFRDVAARRTGDPAAMHVAEDQVTMAPQAEDLNVFGSISFLLYFWFRSRPGGTLTLACEHSTAAVGPREVIAGLYQLALSLSIILEER